ncbi:MAG: PorT family protein [Bacteroidota bacterium]|nr:PorT family protein [Bacteroidota bacterium]
MDFTFSPRLKSAAPPLLIFLAILVCSQKSDAQIKSDSEIERFGFIAGVNISNMNFIQGEPPPDIPAASSWKTGFMCGLQLRVPLTNKLLLQPEYVFSQRNGSDKSLGINYTINYFSLPVLVSYQVFPRLYFIAGPQFEITIDASSSENGITTNITHDVEERGIGVVGGLEFTILRSIFLSCRYMQGLNHVGIGQRSNTKEFKYQVISFTAGIRF